MVKQALTVAVDPETIQQVDQLAREKGWTNADDEENRSKAVRHILEKGIAETEVGQND